MTKEVSLPSGAKLDIQAAPFVDAKALYQTILAEFRGFSFDSTTDMAAVFKEIACIGFSSTAVEKCIWKCLERCLYTATDGPEAGAQSKITTGTFDPVERREDYIKVCIEVARENVGPFMKSLFAQYNQALAQRSEAPK